tara:strand:- start:374 stop:733 length:360 start_codon:yes stop_codon:yes gene_type:complete
MNLLIKKILVLCGISLLYCNNNKVDIWYRTVPDPENQNQTSLYELDMTKGYVYSDGEFVYFVVNKIDDKETYPIVLVFTNGAYWTNDQASWIDVGNDYDDDTFDKYLQKGQKIERLDSK